MSRYCTSNIYYKHTERYLQVFKDHWYIEGFASDTAEIIKKLKALSGDGLSGYTSFVESWLIQNPSYHIDSSEKLEALKSIFSKSQVALIYGSAGTGKSTLINHISNLYNDRKKIYIANTHPAVDNMRRKVNADNRSFKTIKTFLSKYNVETECDILFIDECSTVSNKDMREILETAKFKLLVLVGDVFQIESILFGNWFSIARGFVPETSVFELTLNSYGMDIEANIPNKNDVIIPAFRDLSRKIGAERVIWRYDPILLTSKYTVDYHINYFNEIAKRLSGYTKKCVISFVDLYRNTKTNTKDLGLLPLTTKEMYELAARLVEIADRNNLIVESCAEKINLDQFGIAHGHCIDCNLFEHLLGCKLDLDKDKNQREECGCMASIDIGMYNTCKNGCKYCYANFSEKTVIKNHCIHDPNSPLISGIITEEDVVREREIHSCKQCQLNLFE